LTTAAWFDERSGLDPEELLSVTFPPSRLGRRGYDEESVREFLREVHAQCVRLVNERTSLWQDIQRLRRRIISGQANGHPGGQPNGAPAEEADGHLHGVRVLSAAAREAAVSALNTALSPQAYHQQQAAQADLAYLRTYGDVYRAHLKAYTEGILRGIEDWERKEAASFEEVEPGTPAAGLPAANGNSHLF
jgi:DivIVA domain-containing protein